MNYRFLLCFILLAALKCYAQENISGIVFDKDSKERIASVNIRNVTANISGFNNLKGEFKIVARPGDQLIFSRVNYNPDTVTIKDGQQLAVYLQRTAIQLRQVNVRDTLMSPEQRLEATKRDYSKIYGSLAYKDFLSTPSYGGAGLSIDAIYNALSRSGRNATHLREEIQHDFEQNVIDYRFNKTFVANVTGLKDDRLASFMLRYRPGYYTTTNFSDYDYISMIKANLRRFLRRPRTYSLPPLTGK